MAPQDNASDEEMLTGQLRRMRTNAYGNAERLRSEVLQGVLGTLREISGPGPSGVSPAPDDVIEAEIIDDASPTLLDSIDRSDPLSGLAESEQTHRDYMELFSITDPDAARRKLQQIQQGERERLARKTRSELNSAAIVTTRLRR